jgi:hypothetical protein
MKRGQRRKLTILLKNLTIGLEKLLFCFIAPQYPVTIVAHSNHGNIRKTIV